MGCDLNFMYASSTFGVTYICKTTAASGLGKNYSELSTYKRYGYVGLEYDLTEIRQYDDSLTSASNLQCLSMASVNI